MTIANTSRPTINKTLKEALDEQTEKWGIEIIRAEIKDLEPPKELIISMESVLKADNDRQAAEKTAIAKPLLRADRRTPLFRLPKAKSRLPYFKLKVREPQPSP